ncbi:metal/formaldehyde-sensitive transcriptional repressor [Sphingomonas gilva]|uniref:Metal/formaldehyde-sensitive transcriptional repressor n=1 Tax=Sphingomonas gilva TaxID=2305907 RepID=A0A396RPC8_9SPHN|nr:metal/formaldehyde-sensitive transcriptional repressor [Sphingomonas gilva]RHW18318.1 metal/formaldehyde-sensitive transcriptional repressor [Sphingomonas gilva]
MSHVRANKEQLVARVRRIAGQVAAVERAVVADAPCAETLHLVAAVKGAIAGLMDEIVEEHLRAHVAEPSLSPEERLKGADELAVVIRRYGK